jgi:hypothetical protein
MGVFKYLLGMGKPDEMAGLMPAIERAANSVDPMLKQTRGYPNSYRKPVASALEYARSLALSVPGPVVVNNETYARNAFIHALFPQLNFVRDALCSSRAVQEYRQQSPACHEIYALMGMRRVEKTALGMEMSEQVIHGDIPQSVVYFTSHTIENPAPTEQQARDLIAWSFFDKLVSKVAQRIQARKDAKQSLLQEKDLLMARLRSADASSRPALQAELSGLLGRLQDTSNSLDFSHYLKDFEAVMLNPQQHLRLHQVEMALDSMGVVIGNDDASGVQPLVFNDLVGFDQRNWTVTMVHCKDMRSESFATRLDNACRTFST